MNKSKLMTAFFIFRCALSVCLMLLAMYLSFHDKLDMATYMVCWAILIEIQGARL